MKKHNCLHKQQGEIKMHLKTKPEAVSGGPVMSDKTDSRKLRYCLKEPITIIYDYDGIAACWHESSAGSFRRVLTTLRDKEIKRAAAMSSKPLAVKAKWMRRAEKAINALLSEGQLNPKLIKELKSCFTRMSKSRYGGYFIHEITPGECCPPHFHGDKFDMAVRDTVEAMKKRWTGDGQEVLKRNAEKRREGRVEAVFEGGEKLYFEDMCDFAGFVFFHILPSRGLSRSRITGGANAYEHLVQKSELFTDSPNEMAELIYLYKKAFSGAGHWVWNLKYIRHLESGWSRGKRREILLPEGI